MDQEDRATLLRVARAVQRAHERISLSGLSLFASNTVEAHQHRLAAQKAAGEALDVLGGLGIHAEPSAEVPISLQQLDTPDTRQLLELLQEAQAVAERVDAARGRSLPNDIPLQQGESRGTDLAESISHLALRVRGELHGPKGRD